LAAKSTNYWKDAMSHDHRIKAREYREKAAECQQLAEAASHSETRRSYESIARSFLQMADNMDFLEDAKQSEWHREAAGLAEEKMKKRSPGQCFRALDRGFRVDALSVSSDDLNNTEKPFRSR
jgi:hypothetical protein